MFGYRILELKKRCGIIDKRCGGYFYVKSNKIVKTLRLQTMRRKCPLRSSPVQGMI